MSARLEVRGLSCRYGSSPDDVLRDVDLSLDAGELVLLAGQGASGKTTLLRCLGGLLPRSYRGAVRRGELRLDGEDLTRLSPARIACSVGTLMQQPVNQVVGFDVRRELAFGPENLGLAPDVVERRVERVAARLGLEPLLDRPTGELSGGELQRVALAGVLTMEPRVLLLDEPLAALDPGTAAEVAELLRELAAEGRAVLVVEHRVEPLLAAGVERALLLEDGRLVHDGDVDGFLRRADPRRVALPGDAATRRWRELGPTPEPVAERARVDAAGPPAVELDGVSFAYGEEGVQRRALESASLRVARGERLVLLGANGSGKSTLLRQVVGLLRPDAGVVRVDGEDAAERTTAELARRVGYVFQDPNAMLFCDTVLDECRFGPRSLGLAEPQVTDRAREVVERYGLEGLADQSPGALSTGQRKRVALAAVAALGGTIWLVDEPTAGLDPDGIATFLRALESGGDATVLLATHDADLALTFADRIAVVEGGRVVLVATPAELFLDESALARAGVRPTALVRANRERLERGERPLTPRELAATSANGGGDA